MAGDRVRVRRRSKSAYASQPSWQGLHRTKLSPEAEAIVVAAPGCYQVPVVGVVELEIAGQLLSGGIVGVATVGVLLIFS